MLPPPLLPQELQRYDPLGVMLQPLVSGGMARPAKHQLPDNLLVPAQSTRYLARCHRKRCVPNRGKCLLLLATLQNCDGSKGHSLPTPSAQLQQAYARNSKNPLQNLAPPLARANPSAPSEIA